jgi:hypothetical protein
MVERRADGVCDVLRRLDDIRRDVDAADQLGPAPWPADGAKRNAARYNWP